MKAYAFNVAILGVPTYFATFRVIRLPKWVDDRNIDLKVYDLVYWNTSRDTLVSVRTNRGISLSPRHLSFHSYSKMPMEE